MVALKKKKSFPVMVHYFFTESLLCWEKVLPFIELQSIFI